MTLDESFDMLEDRPQVLFVLILILLLSDLEFSRKGSLNLTGGSLDE